METLAYIQQGFIDILTVQNMLAMLAGVSMGIFFGAMPGLSATTGMVLLLPIAYNLDTITGLAMLGGIFAGALYGGSITAVLLGIPGTAAAMPTTFDGYPMCRQGRAYEALLASLYGSVIGGIGSALVLMFLTPLIAAVAIRFGPPEMFALGIWGLSMVTGVIGGDVVKGVFMAVLGLLCGMIGADPANGIGRFTFGSLHLYSGVSLVPVLLGMLALPRVYEMVENFKSGEAFFKPQGKRKYFLRPSEVLCHGALIARSTLVGIIVGIAPAAGPSVAAVISYNMEAKKSKHPETFGKGNVEGVWAAETANNGATGGDLVLSLALGIPGSAAAAVIMSALIMKGAQPGPNLLTNSSEIVYAFFASFLIVNIFVFFVGHLSTQFGATIIRTPVKLLAAAIVVICMVGAYSDTGMFGLWTMFAVSAASYLLNKMGFPAVPFLLALILCDIMESNFWVSYAMTSGQLWQVLHRPVFLLIMAVAVAFFAMPMVSNAVKRRKGEVVSLKDDTIEEMND